MSGLKYLFLFSAFCELLAVPIVLKESSPNGESVIAISSSNPEVENYFREYAEHAQQKQYPAARNRAQGQGTVVQSFSIATPEKTIAGTGRSFGGDNPFFVPYFASPNLEEFDIRNWLRSIERFYDPSYAGNGGSVSATAVNDNGHLYGKVETGHLQNRGH